MVYAGMWTCSKVLNNPKPQTIRTAHVPTWGAWGGMPEKEVVERRMFSMSMSAWVWPRGEPAARSCRVGVGMGAGKGVGIGIGAGSDLYEGRVLRRALARSGPGATPRPGPAE